MRFVFLPNYCTCSACEFEAEAEQTCHAEERPHAAVKRLRPLESVRSITKGPLSVFFFNYLFCDVLCRDLLDRLLISLRQSILGLTHSLLNEPISICLSHDL